MDGGPNLEKLELEVQSSRTHLCSSMEAFLDVLRGEETNKFSAEKKATTNCGTAMKRYWHAVNSLVAARKGKGVPDCRWDVQGCIRFAVEGCPTKVLCVRLQAPGSTALSYWGVKHTIVGTPAEKFFVTESRKGVPYERLKKAKKGANGAQRTPAAVWQDNLFNQIEKFEPHSSANRRRIVKGSLLRLRDNCCVEKESIILNASRRSSMDSSSSNSLDHIQSGVTVQSKATDGRSERIERNRQELFEKESQEDWTAQAMRAALPVPDLKVKFCVTRKNSEGTKAALTPVEACRGDALAHAVESRSSAESTRSSSSPPPPRASMLPAAVSSKRVVCPVIAEREHVEKRKIEPVNELVKSSEALAVDDSKTGSPFVCSKGDTAPTTSGKDETRGSMATLPPWTHDQEIMDLCNENVELHDFECESNDELDVLSTMPDSASVVVHRKDGPERDSLGLVRFSTKEVLEMEGCEKQHDPFHGQRFPPTLACD
jgi:hypothetical protein